MKALQVIIALVAIMVCAMFIGGINAVRASGDAPLIREDFEQGLRMAKGLPLATIHGLSMAEIMKMDFNRPDLRVWSEHVEAEFFGMNPLYVRLVHAFTLVACNARTGAELSAISLLRSIISHEDFGRLVLECRYFMPAV